MEAHRRVAAAKMGMSGTPNMLVSVAIACAMHTHSSQEYVMHNNSNLADSYQVPDCREVRVNAPQEKGPRIVDNPRHMLACNDYASQ